MGNPFFLLSTTSYWKNMIPLTFYIVLVLLPHICSGIKLELVTHNSLDFPFYQTQPLHVDQTKSVQSTVQGRSVFERLYFAKIGVGTFDAIPNFKTYYLVIDTGSSAIWLQCEECQRPPHHCFPQLNPPFPNSKSHSYIPLKSCEPPNDAKQSHAILRKGKGKGKGRCIKDLGYEGGEQTSVEVASESFTFESNAKLSSETIKLYFGCGINQKGFEINKPGIMSGILGLSRADSSLQFQLETKSGTGLNFSYCFPSVTNKGGPTTYLRFGADVPAIGSNFQGTPLLSLPNDEIYYVKMIDIVVNDHRLHIHPSLFDIHGKYGGVFMDSGASMSLLVNPVYNVLERHLVELFSATPGFRRRPVNNHTTMPPLCYDMLKTKGYKNLPRIKFILQDAHLVIMPRQGFYVGKQVHHHYFCLMMRPNDYGTVIGAYQHVNNRFVYDSSQSKLWFRRENCAKDI